MLLLIYLYHSPGCTPPKKPGFLQNLWIVTRLLAKTRFLGPGTTKETGFFAVFADCNQVLSQKPGCWAPVQPKKPGFLGFLPTVTKYCRKNPVAGPRYNQRNRVFWGFCRL